MNLSRCAIVFISLCLSGCKLGSFHQERLAKKELISVQEQFAFQDVPILTSESTLEEFIRFALLNHPTVKSSYYEWIASVQEITIARALPDPLFLLDVNIQKVIMAVLPGVSSVFVSPSTLRAKVRVATAQSNASYFAFERSLLDAAVAVKNSYFQLDFLRKKKEKKEKVFDLLSKAKEAIEKQYLIEKASFEELQSVTSEYNSAIYELASIEESYTLATDKFKVALGLSLHAEFGMPDHFEYTSALIVSDGFFEEALKNNPKLQQMREQLVQAHSQIALAARGSIPGLRAELQAEVKNRPTTYIPELELSLPVYRDKIRAALAFAEAKHEKAKALLQAEELQLAVDFSEKMFLLKDMERKKDFLQMCEVPQAEESLMTFASSLIVDYRSFLGRIEAEKTLVGLQLELDEIALHREELLAELSYSILGEFPDRAPVRKRSYREKTQKNNKE